MSKAVLIAIHPEWCEAIAERKKKYDFRKARPNIPTPFKALIYMTKGTAAYWTSGHVKCVNDGGRNVIGEFVCDRIERLARVGFSGSRKEPEYCVCDLDMHTKPIDGILADGYLSREELETYLADAVGYAWHISELKIYDKPKELSEFYRREKVPHGAICAEDTFLAPIYSPPQSWCYVEELQK